LLARKSLAVFTLSGTVALEAMVLGVPAFVFSPVFYSHFEGIHYVENPSNLAVLLTETLRKGTAASPAARLAAVAAMYDCSLPGQLHSSISDAELFLAPTNMENISSSFCKLLSAYVHPAHRIQAEISSPDAGGSAPEARAWRADR